MRELIPMDSYGVFADGHDTARANSLMVAEFFGTLGERARSAPEYPPITASLMGVLRDKPLDEDAYKRHLREKHL